jgi:hypothetical protein
MATGQILRCLAAAEHVFAADRAVIFVLVVHAIVNSINRIGNAHATRIAMVEVFTSTDTAKSTFLAMKRLLVHCHPKVAYRAVILSELDATMSALISGQ